jgi:hypothetical protein
VRVVQTVKFTINFYHLRGYPGVILPGSFSAGAVGYNLFKSGIDLESKAVLFQFPLETLRNVQIIAEKHSPLRR